NCAETSEQRQSGLDGVLARTIEPVEIRRISAPRDHVEQRGGEVDPKPPRLATGPQPVARVPEAPDAARRDPSRAAGSLLGGISGDALDVEAVDPPVRIVARDF